VEFGTCDKTFKGDKRKEKEKTGFLKKKKIVNLRKRMHKQWRCRKESKSRDCLFLPRKNQAVHKTEEEGGRKKDSGHHRTENDNSLVHTPGKGGLRKELNEIRRGGKKRGAGFNSGGRKKGMLETRANS